MLGECYVPEDETMGVETFLDRLLVPYLRSKFQSFRAENIIFVLDPACFHRSQVDEKTIAQAVQKRGYMVARASTNDPERRVQAVEGLLTRQIDGAAGFLVAPDCIHIANALEWGHRYKRNTSGTNLTFDKTHHSHIGDAVQYLSLHYNIQVDGGEYRPRAKKRNVVASTYVYA